MKDRIIEIRQRTKLGQFFCKHSYVEGIIHRKTDILFWNPNGDEYTTVCVKCGKIKSIRFVPNWDGS